MSLDVRLEPFAVVVALATGLAAELVLVVSRVLVGKGHVVTRATHKGLALVVVGRGVAPQNPRAREGARAL